MSLFTSIPKTLPWMLVYLSTLFGSGIETMTNLLLPTTCSLVIIHPSSIIQPVPVLLPTVTVSFSTFSYLEGPENELGAAGSQIKK